MGRDQRRLILSKMNRDELVRKVNALWELFASDFEEAADIIAEAELKKMNSAIVQQPNA